MSTVAIATSAMVITAVYASERQWRDGSNDDAADHDDADGIALPIARHRVLTFLRQQLKIVLGSCREIW